MKDLDNQIKQAKAAWEEEIRSGLWVVRYRFSNGCLIFEMPTGASHCIQLDSIPALADATPEQLNNSRLVKSRTAIIFDDLDVELSIKGLLLGLHGNMQFVKERGESLLKFYNNAYAHEEE